MTSGDLFQNESDELKLVQNHYVIGRKIGSGSFGEIFLCRSPSRKQDYVMKREKLPLRVQHLLKEYECLVILLFENYSLGNFSTKKKVLLFFLETS